MPTCAKCQAHFPSWKIIDGQARNLGNRRFCLDCSPFGYRNTRDLTKVEHDSRPTHCLACQVELTEQSAYYKPQSSTFQPYCKACHNRRAHLRQRDIKRLCVEYKGGCCSRCGYNRCLQALEFHHCESDLKEREVSSMKSRSFERLKPELDKCILVCANCHRELHAGLPLQLETAVVSL